jgi:hypothetical protein
MSFDIFFKTCNLGTQRESRKNPFTGETVSVPVDEGLTDAQKSAFRHLLHTLNASGPDRFGCYVLDFADGGYAEVSAQGLDGPDKCDGCMAAVSSLSPQLVQFLFDLGRGGNMILIPAMENPPFVVTSEEQKRCVESRWPEAKVVSSPQALLSLLTKGFTAWQAYWDQVSGE